MDRKVFHRVQPNKADLLDPSWILLDVHKALVMMSGDLLPPLKGKRLFQVMLERAPRPTLGCHIFFGLVILRPFPAKI